MNSYGREDAGRKRLAYFDSFLLFTQRLLVETYQARSPRRHRSFAIDSNFIKRSNE